MRMPMVSDLKPYRARVARTLARHMESPTMVWAVRTVERDLLSFRAVHGYKEEYWTEARMGALKTTGAAPTAVLARVVECYALRRDRESAFPTVKSWHAWLARRVLTIGRHHILPTTCGATQLSFTGRVIADALEEFALATLMRAEKDAAERAAFKRSCEDLAST